MRYKRANIRRINKQYAVKYVTWPRDWRGEEEEHAQPTACPNAYFLSNALNLGRRTGSIEPRWVRFDSRVGRSFPHCGILSNDMRAGRFLSNSNPIANGRCFSDHIWGGRRTGKIRKKPEAYRRVLSRFELSAARDERRWRREEDEREGRGRRDGRRRAEKRCACPRERASNRDSRGREIKFPFKAQILQ